VRKLVTVCGVGVKYYVFFHLIPLVLRIKKSKTRQETSKAVLRTLYEYVKSVLFMGFLVAFTKGALCIKNQVSAPFDGIPPPT
jgi:succinate dehydrogenase/fumarate reductase cytochrome b subunit